MARAFFSGTLLSRCSGLLRDIVMAYCFGSNPSVAAFMVAYRLAHLFRRLIGEGNLSSAFVPQFEAMQDVSKGSLLYRDAAWSLGLIALGLIALFEFMLWQAQSWLTHGWLEIAAMTQWMAPSLLFVVLYALGGALLQCRHRLFSFAASSIWLNATWITAAVTIHVLRVPEPLYHLSIVVPLAFAAQWVAVMYSCHTELKGYLPWRLLFRPHLFSEGVRRLMRPLWHGTLGIGAMQINGALDAIFARAADPSGPAYLWYAIRLEQLPLALFGIALANALLPLLSKAMQEQRLDTYKQLLASGIRHTIALMVPITAAIAALGWDAIALIYRHGAFGQSDVAMTFGCLVAYSISLVPSALTLLIATGFYARHEHIISSRASMASVACNMFFNALFVFAFGWGAVSIALATSIAAICNIGILVWQLWRRMGSFWGDQLGLFTAKISLASLFAWGVTMLCPTIETALISLLCKGALFFIGWAAAAWQLRIDLRWLQSLLKPRSRSSESL
ncbi:MAG: hypothetical protein RL235_711 [Chlamydiota bacterium]|jgi:putative peptidoglycan lipid II flippase